MPLVWPWIAKMIWPHKISWQEMAINVGVILLLTVTLYAISVGSQTKDYEVWNGQTTGKERKKVSCEHSYRCNCVTSCSGSGSSRSCTEICQTCYDHSYDISWFINTTIGDIYVRRVDRQGLDEPQRYTRSELEEPASKLKHFTNYVKAVPESIFNTSEAQIQKYQNLIPKYPDTIYDYHHIDRAIAVGVNVPDIKQWSNDISNMLRVLGAKKKANVVVLFVNAPDSDYIYALERAWIKGKKNDLIVVIGTTNYPEINWARVIGWSKNETVKIEIRDGIQELEKLDRISVMSIIESSISGSSEPIRREMEEFKYLEDQIEPPMWTLIAIFLLGLFGSIGLSYHFRNN